MVAFTSEGGILTGNGELFVIHELRHQGLSISAIARHTDVARISVSIPRFGRTILNATLICSCSNAAAYSEH